MSRGQHDFLVFEMGLAKSLGGLIARLVDEVAICGKAGGFFVHLLPFIL